LMDLSFYLYQINQLAEESGMCLVELHTNSRQAGLFSLAQGESSVPLAAYVRNYSSPQACMCAPPPLEEKVVRVTLKLHDATCREPGSLRLAQPRYDATDRSVSVSVCSDPRSATPGADNRAIDDCPTASAEHRPLSAAVLEAVKHVHSALAGKRFILVVGMSGGHEHNIFKGINYYGTSGGFRSWQLSEAMAAVANAVIDRHLSCGIGSARATPQDKRQRPPSHGAILRIIYSGGSKMSASRFGDVCAWLLESTNQHFTTSRDHTAVRGGERGKALVCRPTGYLATDWFALADRMKSQQHLDAVNGCWDKSMGNASSPTWWWASDERLIRPLVRASAPALLEPHRWEPVPTPSTTSTTQSMALLKAPPAEAQNRGGLSGVTHKRAKRQQTGSVSARGDSHAVALSPPPPPPARLPAPYSVNDCAAYSYYPDQAFRAFLDLAVMSAVDNCFAYGHMGRVVDQLRAEGRRPLCQRP